MKQNAFFAWRGTAGAFCGKEGVAVEANDAAACPGGKGVTHAFVADSGAELERPSITERINHDAVLPTLTRASCWWPGSLTSTGRVGSHRTAGRFDGEP